MSTKDELPEIAPKASTNVTDNPKQLSKVIPLFPRTTSDAISNVPPAGVSLALVDLYDRVLRQKMSKNQFKSASAAHPVGGEGWLYLGNRTRIEIINSTGDARITQFVEVVNLSQTPTCEIIHRYWIERPQGKLTFSIRRDDGDDLSFYISKNEPNHRQLHLCLGRYLEQLETVKYSISFLLPFGFLDYRFYLLSPRFQCLNLGLTVLAAPDYPLGTPRIVCELPDGFTKDKAPLPAVCRDGNLTGFSWEATAVQPGEKIRTYWEV